MPDGRAARPLPYLQAGGGVESDDSEWRPFCSERCKLIDLGAWFSDERSIPD